MHVFAYPADNRMWDGPGERGVRDPKCEDGRLDWKGPGQRGTLPGAETELGRGEGVEGGADAGGDLAGVGWGLGVIGGGGGPLLQNTKF